VKQCLGALEAAALGNAGRQPATFVLDIKAANHDERDMRTTLTIDDDVAAAIDHLRRVRNASLKQIVNEALRRGIRDMTIRKRGRRIFRTRSVSLGSLLIPSLDNIGEVLAAAEGKAFK
jgi:Ribbon-helix-helix protein, copG family